MSEQGMTTSGQAWPQQHTGHDGTTYWVDSAGQVFSAVVHMGPEDDNLGVDAEGLWIKRAKRRGWQKRKPRGPRAPGKSAAPPVPSPMPRPLPDAVWVVWHAESGQLETIGAYADPIEALERLIDTPGGRVARALIQ